MAERLGAVWRSAAEGWRAACRCTAFAGLSVCGFGLLVALTSAASVILLGVGLLAVLVLLVSARLLINVQRGFVTRWTGEDAVPSYAPPPADAEGVRGWPRRALWIVSDVETWRDVAWLLLDSWLGPFVTLLPMTLLLTGVWGLTMPVTWSYMADAWGSDNWYGVIPLDGPVDGWLAALLGVAEIPFALWLAPRVLRGYGRAAAVFIAPRRSVVLSRRVERLAETRSGAVSSAAAEIRRIERDLHDGAQARLVAMGMTLDAARRRLRRADTDAALELVDEAHESSLKALSELRDLVRGVHPPVLADRGLVAAVEALARDCPVPVDVTARLAGPLEPPVESAVYFAVSELLTNMVRHSGADRASVELSDADGALTVRVDDDGAGGADPVGGTGLFGVERRLAAFDGTLRVDSPRGGPTRIEITLPFGPPGGR
ncbi:sensor histidine kinase [Actinomadura atramentaria]|uniref:sensor histidine kinase n=1 Tax=Actinomadura atramentaria TaxID=1990 RepID=UPI000370811D|nr:sensor domain-containing protein [Actinomadura atramentaria]